MTMCEEAMYTCGAMRDAVTGREQTTSLGINYNREISLTVGAKVIPIQERLRVFEYSDSIASTSSGFKYVAVSGDYYPCYTGSVTADSSFSDHHDTLDTELMYLDLRHDVVVVKEITDSLKATSTERTASPSATVQVFTGYEQQTFFPWQFANMPIAEVVTYRLHVGGETIELNREEVTRGQQADLLMPTFPWSPNGIRIDTPWAKDVEWYRQDLKKLANDDGDAFLFYADWIKACGQLDQAMDKLNTDLVWTLDHQLEPETITNPESYSPMVSDKFFRGSVAFDGRANRFYSIAVPASEYATDPAYILKQGLTVNGSPVTIPTDAEADTWYPISPI